MIFVYSPAAWDVEIFSLYVICTTLFLPTFGPVITATADGEEMKDLKDVDVENPLAQSVPVILSHLYPKP